MGTLALAFEERRRPRNAGGGGVLPSEAGGQPRAVARARDGCCEPLPGATRAVDDAQVLRGAILSLSSEPPCLVTF